MSISSNARIVIIARALRTFGYGFTSVLLGIMLIDAGASPLQIGTLLAVAALGSIVCSLVMGMYADRVGRKRLLILSALLMMVTGYVFALAQWYPLLVLASFFGTISPSTNDNSPFSGIEQAILAQSVETERYTRLFSSYNLIAQLAGAVGGLMVGLPQLLERAGINANMSVHLLFMGYGLIAGCTVFLYLGLSSSAELQKISSGKQTDTAAPGLAKTGWSRFALRLPETRVLKLSGLFAVDAFAGGLTSQTVLALWYWRHFGASLEMLGLLFFAMNLLAALAFLPSVRLEERLGLLKTMVIPHGISNVCLLLVPFMPTLPLAVMLLLLRQLLCKLDISARQAYTAALILPEERTIAASFTTIARSAALLLGPLSSGLILSVFYVGRGVPLIFSACIDLGYDVTLWGIFKKISLRPSDERKSFTQFLPLHFPSRSLPINYPVSLDDNNLWGVLTDVPLYSSDQAERVSGQFKSLHFPRS